MLNINQPADELAAIHGAQDYYWYLRHPDYLQAVMIPIAQEVNILGLPCVDAGCGEAMLAEHVLVPYYGFDGSSTAIVQAVKRRGDLLERVRIGRLEDPPPLPGLEGPCTLVLAGILEVLVLPDRREEFVRLYMHRYGVEWLIVCDLDRLDVTPLVRAYSLARNWTVCVPELVGPDGTPLQEAKRHRRVWVFHVGN